MSNEVKKIPLSKENLEFLKMLHAEIKPYKGTVVEYLDLVTDEEKRINVHELVNSHHEKRKLIEQREVERVLSDYVRKEETNNG
jgi:hypothetical protein